MNKFTAFSQNWPEGSPCHVQEHDYNHLLGWLHPLPQQPTINVSDVQEQLKNEADALTKCQTSLQTTNDQLSQMTQQKADLQNNFNALQLSHDSLKSENTALINEADTFTTDRKNYNDAANLSKSQTAQITEYFDTLLVHLGVNIKSKPDDQLTSEGLLAISQQYKTISYLQSELKRYLDVKNAVSQTVDAIPSPAGQSFGKWLMSQFWVQGSK